MRLAVVRFLLEADFLVLVAAAAGLAGLDAIWIGVVMFGAWLLVALVERTGSTSVRAAPRSRRARAAPNRSQSRSRADPSPSRARTGPEPEPAPVLAAAPPPPRAEPEPEPEPEPAVVPLVLRDSTPRKWNLWELERLAETMNGDDIAAEERDAAPAAPARVRRRRRATSRSSSTRWCATRSAPTSRGSPR